MSIRNKDLAFEHFFLARHGAHKGYRLTDTGCQRIEMLGKVIKEISDGCSVYLISSTAPRALESSEILIAELGLAEFEQVPYLADPSPDRDIFMNIMKEREDRADGLVVVTHQELLEVHNDLGGIVDPGYAIHVDNTGQGEPYTLIPLDNRFARKD